MSDLYASLVIALILQATAMSVPGQNHFLILSASNQGALTRSLIVIGIATAGIVFSAGAAFTIYLSGQAFSDRVFGALGLMGSGFLVYLGIKTIRGGLKGRSRSGDAERVDLSPAKAFSSGFLVNLSNAKSVLFFSSVFATTLPLATMSFGNHAFVVAAFFLNSVFIHGSVSALLATPAIRKATDAHRPMIQVISGGVFLLFAVLSAAHILGA